MFFYGIFRDENKANAKEIQGYFDQWSNNREHSTVYMNDIMKGISKRVVNSIKILFICSRNKWRSLTAEKIFQGFNGYDAKSAGTEDNARIKVTSGHIGWADLIFAMEKKHVRRIKEKFGDMLLGKRIICLDIPDDYRYMDEELIEVMKSRVSEYLEVPE